MYALDGSAEQDRPYQVIINSYTVELLQPIGGQEHAVCLTRPRETVTYHYERRLYDIEQAYGTRGNNLPDTWSAETSNEAVDLERCPGETSATATL